MSQPRRYGRTELSAYQTSTEVLVLGGQSFTKEDLSSLPSAEPVLVQLPQPAGFARADELAQLQAEVARTLSQQTRAVKLRRTPKRHGKHWMLGGRRLLASEIQLDDQGQPFVPRTYASVEEALQQLVFEFDGARSGGSNSSSNDISSPSSTLEN